MDGKYDRPIMNKHGTQAATTGGLFLIRVLLLTNDKQTFFYQLFGICAMCRSVAGLYLGKHT